jgi:tetratricopeptide (TPR) repeat protein
MRNAIRKLWARFIAPPRAAAFATLYIVLTISAQANHCLKINEKYSGEIKDSIKAMDNREISACDGWKKALAATSVLKQTAMRKDCYHGGPASHMADMIQRFTKQEADFRDNTKVFCEFGDCFGATRDLAITTCTRAIDSNAFTGVQLADIYARRANIYDGDGDQEREISDLDEAIRLYPKSSGYFNSRCWARATIGRDLEKALADCNESLRLKSNDSDTMDSRGFVYLRLNRFEDAIAQYNEALRLDPRKAASLYGRGVAKLRKGDAAAGNADIMAAKEIRANIADDFDKYGVKSDTLASPSPAASSSTTAPAANCARAETHWKSVEEIGTAAVYEDHLRRFPNCEFAVLAKARLEALKKMEELKK